MFNTKSNTEVLLGIAVLISILSVGGMMSLSSFDLSSPIGEDGGEDATIVTTLSIMAPTSSTVGSNYTVTGRLRTGTTEISGKTISLSLSVDGGSSWYRLGSSTTSSGAGYSYSISPTIDGEYRTKATFAGDGTYASSASSVAITTVSPGTSTPILSISVSPTDLTVGSAIRITGSLTTSGGDGLDGRTIDVKYSTGGSWTTIGVRTTLSSGAFMAVDWTPPSAVTHFVKASFSGDTAGSVRYTLVDSSTISITVNPVSSPPSDGSTPPPTLTATAISATHPSSVMYGDSVVISGSLTASSGLAGKTVKVEVMREGGVWNTLGILTTASDGSFSVLSWTPSRITTYQVKATFAGDTTYASSQSTSSISVTSPVAGGEVEPTAEVVFDTFDEDAPIQYPDPIILTGIIIIIGLAIVMLARRRKIR